MPCLKNSATIPKFPFGMSQERVAASICGRPRNSFFAASILVNPSGVHSLGTDKMVTTADLSYPRSLSKKKDTCRVITMEKIKTQITKKNWSPISDFEKIASPFTVLSFPFNDSMALYDDK